MHVGFSYQNELPTLPGTFRKKIPSQTVAGIAGGELAGEPRPCRGRSGPYGRTVRKSQPNQQSLWNFFGLPKFVRWTVSPLGADGPQVIFQPYTETPRNHVFDPEWSAVGRRTVRQMVRRLEPDGPLLPSRTVRISQAGRSAFSCSLGLHLAMINPHMYYMSLQC